MEHICVKYRVNQIEKETFITINVGSNHQTGEGFNWIGCFEVEGNEIEFKRSCKGISYDLAESAIVLPIGVDLDKSDVIEKTKRYLNTLLG